MRRVLALIDTVSVSGPGRQLAALAAELTRHDVEVRIILLRRTGRTHVPYADYLVAQGIQHTVLADEGARDWRIVQRIHQAINDWPPDIVQTHSYRMTVVAAALRLSGARWPWIGFFHGATAENYRVRLYHRLDRCLLGMADAIVVMSQAHARQFSHYGKRVHVVHNAVIPIVPPITGKGKELVQQAGRPMLGVAGRLSYEKGVDVFLEACKLLADNGESFTAGIAGEGPELESLLARRDALGLADRVRFWGPVADMRVFYRAVDLLVIPSRSEGLPNVLLEALAADLPVVSTSVGAIPEVISNELTGILVPPDDSTALARAIVAGLPLCREPAARAARTETVRHFSLRRRTASVMRLYASLIGKARLFGLPSTPR